MKWKVTRPKLWTYVLAGVLSAVLIGEVAYMMDQGLSSLPVTGLAPNFTATDVSTGEPVSLASLHGKVVLMTWYYTHCPNICPLTMYDFEQVQDQLEKEGVFGSKVVLLAVTFDPVRDTPPVIRAYSAHFHANPAGWYFLRATPGATAGILQAWGVQVKQSSNPMFYLHTTKTVLIDQFGNIRWTYPTEYLNPTQIVSNVQNLIARASDS